MTVNSNRKIDRFFWEEIARPFVSVKTGGQTHGPSTSNLVLEGNFLNVDVEIVNKSRLLILQHAYLCLEDKSRGARLHFYQKKEGVLSKLRASPQNIETPSELERIEINSIIMDVWKHAETLSPLDLCSLIMNRGNLNKISMSDPEWFDFHFVARLLKKLEDKKNWDAAVLLLNNVLNYEISNGKNTYLMKQLKISYLDNNVQGRTPCIYRYVDEKHPRSQFKPYEFFPSKEDEQKGAEEGEESSSQETDKENESSNPLHEAQKKIKSQKPAQTKKKFNWFSIWNSSKYRCSVYGIEFRVFPISESPIPRVSRINRMEEYQTVKDINVFTGYKWTFAELKEAYESHHGQETVRKYLNHLLNVICDSHNEQYNCLINTFAHFVQRPGVKTQYCVYVKGQKGIGKSLLLFTPFQLLFHQHTCYLAGQLLADDFNGRLRDGVLLVNLDEFPQNIRNMQAFKSQITQGYMNVRPMFHEAETVPNLMNFIITSNFIPSRQMEITPDERRFLLIEAKKFDTAQLKAHCASMTDFAQNYLFEHGKNTGFKAIAYYFLKEVQAPGENLHLKIPVTPLMCKIIERNMNPMERAVKRWIEQGGIRSKLKDENRYVFDWDNMDMGYEWNWKELREQALLLLNEDKPYRQNVATDTEVLKQFILTDMKTRQGNKKGEITAFKIMDRKSHYLNFRKHYPHVVFYWTHTDLILSEDVFATAALSGVLNDPDLSEIRSETKQWTELDFQLAITQARRALKRKGITLALAPEPQPLDSKKDIKRLRVYDDKEREIREGSDEEEDE